jgi:hypothetical protein
VEFPDKVSPPQKRKICHKGVFFLPVLLLVGGGRGGMDGRDFSIFLQICIKLLQRY